MAVLGTVVSVEIRNSVLRTAGDEWGAFLGAFLEPHIQDLRHGEGLTEAQAGALDDMFVDTPLGESLVAIKIWTTEGKLIYSTSGRNVGQTFQPEEVEEAARGETVVEFDETDSPESRFEDALAAPLIEVYAPLHRRSTREIIAVGELYEESASLTEEMNASRVRTWIVVCLTTLLMLAVLYLIVRRGGAIIARQGAELGNRVVEANRLAAQNETLRVQADRARLDASEANEQLLARIGSDLHDGPIQLLTLLLLRLGAGKGGTEAESGLAQLTVDSLTELRNISSGLSLPELNELNLRQTLELAVLRHEDLTGTNVASEFGELPEWASPAVRTCAYRIIQEALNNSSKHAPAARQLVASHSNDATLFISISDNGPGLGAAEKEAGSRHKLGLAGMRNRVGALRGSLAIHSSQDEGTRIAIALPLYPDGGLGAAEAWEA